MTGVQALGSTANSNFVIPVTKLSRSSTGIASTKLLGSAPAAPADQSAVLISGLGLLLANLQELQAQSPADFEQALAQAVSQLRQAAQGSSAGDAQYLTSLANKLEHAGVTGRISTLQPKPGGSFIPGAQPTVKPPPAASASPLSKPTRHVGPPDDLDALLRSIAEQVGRAPASNSSNRYAKSPAKYQSNTRKARSVVYRLGRASPSRYAVA